MRLCRVLRILGVQSREKSPASGTGAVSLSGSILAPFDGKGRGAAYGRTPLHKAARKGNVDEVRRHLQTIKVSEVDDDGSTALHDAVLSGDDVKAAEVSHMLMSSFSSI